MAKVHGIHEIDLNPGVSGEQFERFFVHEVLPAQHPSGVRFHLWKGDRGERAGKYAVVIEIDSVGRRDEHFPTHGSLGEEAQRMYGEQNPPAWVQTWATLASFPGEDRTVYTDYVTMGE